VASCAEYEQGAFAVVAATGCPKTRASTANIDEGIVNADLVKLGGKPRHCEGVSNETIVRKNGTAVSGMGAWASQGRNGLGWGWSWLLEGRWPISCEGEMLIGCKM